MDTKQVALISGAGRGIGAATARELARRGYHVIVNYRSDSQAAALVVKAIESEGGTARAIQADVCDAGQVAAMVGTLDRVDLLVCNANTVMPPFEPFAALPWDTFARKVNGELAGVYHLTQQVLALMRDRRSGRIVYVSSTAADQVGSVMAHSIAKAALNVFSRHIAADAGRYGVTVNTVAAGAVRTEATAKVFNDDLREYLADRSVLGRLLEPEDIARAIAVLADDAFGAGTGQVINVDGGYDVLEQQLGGMGAKLTGTVAAGPAA
jgi:3-oxoacyl-[acyl-carrier protein] reductase